MVKGKEIKPAVEYSDEWYIRSKCAECGKDFMRTRSWVFKVRLCNYQTRYNYFCCYTHQKKYVAEHTVARKKYERQGVA